MPEVTALEVMQAAASCNHCFDTISGLQRVAQGLPKPRWIGERYWAATHRIVVVLLNPGDSTNLGEAWNRRERECFASFYRDGDYQLIREYFRTRRDEEKNAVTRAKPTFTWYEDTFGLDFEEIAQINVAWCASRGNQYRSMLRPCFERHTGLLLQALEPHAVLLSGSGTHQFDKAIKELIPTVYVQKTVHYAHREGVGRNATEAADFRAWLARVKAC
jgi:hypothetical protein